MISSKNTLPLNLVHCCASYRLAFQALSVPLRLIQALFFRIMGSLCLIFRFKEGGAYLLSRAVQIESQCENLLQGLWLYGRRFLVPSDNRPAKCRGSCYWLIEQHLKSPQIPLTEWAKSFENGPPERAFAIHNRQTVPEGLCEEKIWSCQVRDNWKQVPFPESLPEGVYTFLVGFSEEVNRPGKGHRITFFQGDEAFLFDPNTGLSKWVAADWCPLLKRTAELVRTSRASSSFFTVECYRYCFCSGNRRSSSGPQLDSSLV